MATGVQVWSPSPAHALRSALAASSAALCSGSASARCRSWAEGMAPSAVDDSARSMMASVAKWRDDNNGTVLTSGSTAAFTAVTNQVESALTAGFTVALQFHATNDVNATLAVDGLAAKPLQQIPGTNVPLGAFPTGTIQHFTYSTTDTGQWVAHGFQATANFFTAALGSSVNFSTAPADGPSVSVGSTASGPVPGSYLVTGSVAFNASNNTGAFFKLWDGTTVIASATNTLPSGDLAAGIYPNVALSGLITSPAGNLKITGQCVVASGAGGFLSSISGTTNASIISRRSANGMNT